MNENTEEYKYELDTWEGGTLVTPAKVDLTTGIVTPAVYSGNTPITPERLEIMNQGIKKLYEEGAISKDIYIGPEEDAPSEAKIIIDSNQMKTPTNIEQTIDNKLSPIRGTILWTNSDPTSAINVDTQINLSSSDYDFLKIIFKRSTNQNVIYTYETLRGSVIELFCNSTSGDSAPWVRSRILQYVNDNTYTMKTSESYLQFCNSSSRSNEKTGCIPLYIVGYKTGLFSKEVNE